MAAATFLPAAALARSPLPHVAPHRERGTRYDYDEDYDRRRVHFALLAGRNIIQRQNRSTRMATAVHTPNPPPAKSTPSL